MTASAGCGPPRRSPGRCGRTSAPARPAWAKIEPCLGARQPPEVVDGRRRPMPIATISIPVAAGPARPARRRPRRRRGSRRSGSRRSGSGRSLTSRSPGQLQGVGQVRACRRPRAGRSRPGRVRTLSVASAWSVTWSENEIRPTSVVVKSHRSRNARAAVWASSERVPGHARRDVDQQVDRHRLGRRPGRRRRRAAGRARRGRRGPARRSSPARGRCRAGWPGPGRRRWRRTTCRRRPSPRRRSAGCPRRRTCRGPSSRAARALSPWVR